MLYHMCAGQMVGTSLHFHFCSFANNIFVETPTQYNAHDTTTAKNGVTGECSIG